MKNYLISKLVVLFCLYSIETFAQAPQAIPYQGIARDNTGAELINTNVNLQLSVVDGSASGTIIYVENHNTTTNDFGLINVNIGEGTAITGTFSSIGWSNGNKFLKVELDPNGGNNFIDMGTTQMMSVPYALHAETSSDSWSLRGNAGTTSSDFIGTTDSSPLNFWTDSIERLKITHSGDVYIGSGFLGLGIFNPPQKLSVGGNGYFIGNLGLGISNPSEKLHVSGNGYITGNLGVGAFAPPQHKLHVTGNTYISGNIGLGTSPSSQRLEVSGNTFISGNLGLGFFGSSKKLTVGGDTYITGNLGLGTSTPSQKLHVIGNGEFSGSVIAACATLSCSDIRYKHTIQPLQNSLEKIIRLNGVSYYWKTEEFKDLQFTKDRQIGIIAQELEILYPEIVHTDENGYKTVDYSRLTPILIEAVKEQNKIIEEMKAAMEEQSKNISDINSSNDEIRNEFESLKKLILNSDSEKQFVTNNNTDQ